MNRRNFLKTAGFGTIALMLGGVGFRVGGLWWDQEAGDRFQVLSVDESKIVQALADTMFPGDSGSMPNGAAVGLPLFFDEYLVSIPELTSKLLRVLLHLIDDTSVFSDFGLTRFHLRPRTERVEILKAWDTSLVGVRRGMFHSIKLILSMGYFENPAVLRAAGIHFSCGGVS